MRITFNTMCEFEKTTNKSLFEVLKTKNIGLNDIRAIVKSAFEIEETDAGKLIEDYIEANGFEKFSEIINSKVSEFYDKFDKKK